MTGIDHYYVFMISGIILNITPGADTLYILSRSIAQGRKAGILSVLGISTGSIIHSCAAALGLSLILARSAAAYTAVKYLGAGYLLYLGIRIIAQRSNPIAESEAVTSELTDSAVFRQGMITNLLNPKVALFFISFLPQFINPSAAGNPVPFLILGATFIATGTVWCMFLACAAAAISRIMRGNIKTAAVLQKLCGTVFIGLGLKIALLK